MKVYVLPGDVYGCGHYRLIWAADVLRKEGYDIQILPPAKDSGFQAEIKEVNGKPVLAKVMIPEDADVIVVQRPAHPLQPQLAELLRQNGKAFVVDMDDDMSTIHPSNKAFHIYRPSSNTPFSWRWATETCKRATLVTTSTSHLQKTYAAHGRGMVIDNFVPQAYLNYPQAQTGKFGWAGSVASHPNDLQGTRPAVQQLIDAGYPFHVVGEGGRGVQEALRLKEQPTASGTTTLDKWAETIALSLDVGIIPLASTSFNSAKSRLKGIEYMATGVAWVASPRTEYRKLQKDSGVGLLAETPKEWFASVKRLMDDEALRKDHVEAGYEYMRTQTYEQQAWRWAEAWTKAYEMEQG